MISLLIATLLWPFSAGASYHSCISVNHREPDLPARSLKVSPEQPSTWRATLFDNTTKHLLGAFIIRRLSDSGNLTIFASTDFTLTMYEPRKHGHRESSLQIPSLKIDSDDWICKEVP